MSEKPKLLDLVRNKIRVKYHSIRTETAYVTWIKRYVNTHTFRHSFATRLLEDGYDIRWIQKLLGHKDLNTIMIYTHVTKQGGLGVRSPLDRYPQRFIKTDKGIFLYKFRHIQSGILLSSITQTVISKYIRSRPNCWISLQQLVTIYHFIRGHTHV